MDIFELIHQIIKESVSGGFAKFCGYWIMTVIFIGAPVRIIGYFVSGFFSLFRRNCNCKS